MSLVNATRTSITCHFPELKRGFEAKIKRWEMSRGCWIVRCDARAAACSATTAAELMFVLATCAYASAKAFDVAALWMLQEHTAGTHASMRPKLLHMTSLSCANPYSTNTNRRALKVCHTTSCTNQDAGCNKDNQLPKARQMETFVSSSDQP